MNNKPITFTDREALWQQLAQQPDKCWDVIVVGGGIIGAGVLREVTRRGLSAILIEQKDFAWGTSSRSSKMVHGGLRYIAQGDIKLTRQSVQERERLIAEAPGLIYRTKNYFLIKKWQFPGRFIMSLVLALYDKLAGIKDHRFVDASQVSKHFPGINKNQIKGACYYSDTATDDARLVLRVLQESIATGARVLNYVRAIKLIKIDDRVSGIQIEKVDDEQAGKQQTLSLKASVVINATGAWADALRGQIVTEKCIRPLRGSHIIIARQRLKVDGILAVLHPKDKRPVFIFPWEGVTVIGTTDLDHAQDLNIEASISSAEVDYLFEILSLHFPDKKLSVKDVIATYAGVRPVMSSDKSKSPSKERRDHAVWADKGLVTVSGGKLTTFRLTALDALKAAEPWLDKNQTSEEINIAADERVFSSIDAKWRANFDCYDQDWIQRLIGRYGNNTEALLSGASEQEIELISTTQFCLAECRWAARNESVVHLDDLLLRRTRLGLLLKNGAEQLLPKLQEICLQELGWDQQKWQYEVSRYQNIWQQYYGLPSKTVPSPSKIKG